MHGEYIGDNNILYAYIYIYWVCVYVCVYIYIYKYKYIYIYIYIVLFWVHNMNAIHALICTTGTYISYIWSAHYHVPVYESCAARLVLCSSISMHTCTPTCTHTERDRYIRPIVLITSQVWGGVLKFDLLHTYFTCLSTYCDIYLLATLSSRIPDLVFELQTFPEFPLKICMYACIYWVTALGYTCLYVIRIHACESGEMPVSRAKSKRTGMCVCMCV